MSRVHLDPNDPFIVLDEEPVFTFPQIPAANGLVLKGATFYMVSYLTGLEVSSVLAFEVEEDGTVGPTRRVAGSLVSTFDDLEVIGDRILVTNHFLRSILMFDLEGNLLADSGPQFDSPTALTWGRPPMFEPTDLVIAERGLLGEADSNYGNVLSVFRPHSP